MLGKRNTRLAVVLVTIGIAIGITATLSFITLYGRASDTEQCKAENNCASIIFNGSNYMIRGQAYHTWQQDCMGLNRCTIVTANGTNYMLKGEAYDAYVESDNLVVPFYRMKFISQLMDEVRRELIVIDGRDAAEVDRLVDEYTITEATSKTVPVTDAQNQPTGQLAKSMYGYIYKNDLIRFTNENNPESLKSKFVYGTGSVGGVQSDNGDFYPEFVPSPEQNEQIVAEYKKIKENEIARILNEKEGVVRLSDQDFFPIQ